MKGIQMVSGPQARRDRGFAAAPAVAQAAKLSLGSPQVSLLVPAFYLDATHQPLTRMNYA